MSGDEPDWTRFWEGKRAFRSFLFYRIYERFRARSYFSLLKNMNLKDKRILELGGGSGYICKLICEKFDCKGTVVDNNEKAYEIFKRVIGNERVNYILEDMFKHEKRGYDLVFSDGLIEHFHLGKREDIISLHRKFAKKGGFVMFFVPKKSWLVERFMSMEEGYEEKMDSKQLIEETSIPGLKLVSTNKDFHMIGVLYKAE
ncbi:MAG: methyltransferase domain-containing protein [Candidatus Aenigmarchaeota archaeon]|nr:methyltransferase domain-containing protein [Candidatus Aenigmarchaeota archaeon]NIP39917.1 methyltransferase domain-containing protein [Candidatus Aenigmarchaeota archaeon]NIQ17636.1 methyltransferase domain-containing protein [Candidatus Aenigmarchaeota archaeon]NIS72824.1 methyltransferase domain-containing protein [Candidatus Aenigmarchaeota archaeon]